LVDRGGGPIAAVRVAVVARASADHRRELPRQLLVGSQAGVPPLDEAVIDDGAELAEVRAPPADASPEVVHEPAVVLELRVDERFDPRPLTAREPAPDPRHVDVRRRRR
jgi:hypothetical protein